MSEQTPQDWNPRSPEILADQRHAYDDMRERCPVAYSDALHWSVFRHADVITVLDDPATFINSSRLHAIPNALNGPDHARSRQILAEFFSAEMMEQTRPDCRSIAIETLDGLEPAGDVDAVADIAEPIALRSMCAFLGWPDTVWTRVRAWLHGNRTATFAQDRAAAHALAAEYAAMVVEALDDHRRREVQDDVTGRLMAIATDGHRWSDDDIVATLRNWIAGHGTVAAAIGIVIAHLAQDQNLQQQLRARPDLIESAIDEIPRTDGPLVSNARTTTSTVIIENRPIPAGERLSLMWIAANRDPRVFEAPDEIRLGRDQQANVLYGAGIHYCLGAPLARLQLQVTVETLLDRTRAFTLASDASLEREPYPGNGFVAVPIRLTER
jgi:cytochrome P450